MSNSFFCLHACTLKQPSRCFFSQVHMLESCNMIGPFKLCRVRPSWCHLRIRVVQLAGNTLPVILVCTLYISKVSAGSAQPPLAWSLPKNITHGHVHQEDMFGMRQISLHSRIVNTRYTSQSIPMMRCRVHVSNC